MSGYLVRKVMLRALSDQGFRSMLIYNSENALKGFRLTAGEMNAFAAFPTNLFSRFAGKNYVEYAKIKKSYPVNKCMSPAQVLLISMPFAAINQPSAALGLLKASVIEQGINVHTRYLNLEFAKLVGVEIYQDFFMKAPKSSLLQEWVFSGALFENHKNKQETYIKLLKKNRLIQHENRPLLKDAMIMRDLVSEFLNVWINSAGWKEYSIIGFSVTYQQVVASLALAKLIKEVDRSKVIVFGGSCCNGKMGIELHRQFPYIDYVFTSESDLSFPKFVTKALKKEPIEDTPGLVRRYSGMTKASEELCNINRDLDSLPYPDYGDYFDQLNKFELVDQVIPKVPVETSRGCWWGEKSQCTFCGYNSEGIEFRSKTPTRIISELVYLMKNYDCSIEATDSILNNSYFEDLLPAITRTDLDINLFFETKASLSEKELTLLQKAGVWRIQPGIETLSTPILKLIRKGTTTLQNIRILKLCAELGIACNWLFLFGLPGEDEMEYSHMVELVPSIVHLEPPIRCQKIRLERFSPLFNFPDKYGLLNIKHTIGYEYVYPFDSDTLDNIAYYFDFDYSDGRSLDYAKPLINSVKKWQQRKPYYRLDMIMENDVIYLWDFRPCSKQPLTILDVYEMCGNILNINEIYRNLSFVNISGEQYFQINNFLQEMCSKRLMLRDGNTYLSLAVRYHPDIYKYYSQGG